MRWAGAAQDSRSVRITLELLRARDERQLWSTTYDRVIDDIFEVQSDIAAQVVERLGVTLLEGERDPAERPADREREAYTLYLKGRYFWNKRTEEDIETALDYFQQAVDLDPGYSRAWVGIADVWIFRGWYSLLAPRETFPRPSTPHEGAGVRQHAGGGPRLAGAHPSSNSTTTGAAAEREYRRAIAARPQVPDRAPLVRRVPVGDGSPRRALQQAEKARALDPCRSSSRPG